METSVLVENRLNDLEEEDYKIALNFIEFLAVSRKKKRAEESKKILLEIQGLFTGDEGWASEEEMLKEMADFRKKHSFL